MGKNIFWAVLTVLIIGCSGGSGGSDDHDGEDGRTSATPVANHNSVAPGTCNTCHNGNAAEGKNSSHIPTTASCDTCHRTTGWEPATINHGNVAPGTCATCHNGTTARGKSSTHISTTDSCDTCHLTTGWMSMTSSTSTIDFPVEAVFTSLALTASTYSASATDAAGNSFLLSVNRIPGPDKIDQQIYPLSLKTYLQSNTIRKNGNITSTKNFEDFYSVAPFYMFGSLNNISGLSNLMKVTTQLQLPPTGRVGASGVIYRGRNYINKSTVSFDTWYATWSLEADSATTAWLCFKTEITPASGPAGLTAETDCFRVNQTGDIIGFKADIIENGITLGYR